MENVRMGDMYSALPERSGALCPYKPRVPRARFPRQGTVHMEKTTS
jgi:hypothetical protein